MKETNRVILQEMSIKIDRMITLMESSLKYLNYVPNVHKPLGGFKNSYELAAAIDNLLKGRE